MGEVVSIKTERRKEEADLVDRCRRGDSAALQEVFRAHSPYLEGLLSRLTGSGVELEDVLQRTFVAAIRGFPRFRGEASVRTWLARIAVRTASEQLRKPERKRRVDVGSLELCVDHEQAPSIDRQADARRRLDRLHHHLDAIKTKKRVAFILHVFEGHSIEEVAALTSATQSATKSRIFWARRELMRRAARDPVLADLIEENAS